MPKWRPSRRSGFAIRRGRGFLNYTALANECYGEYLLYDLKDDEGANYYLEQATLSCSEWKAFGKVELLRRKHSRLWPMPSTVLIENDS
jgi:hypothetical protein